MKASDWIVLCVGIATVCVGVISVFAIYWGPIKALRIQRELDDSRQVRSRKMAIFRDLMSNRATRMSPVFVQALNLIDIEFSAADEKSIRDSWRELQDHFNEWGRMTAAQKQEESNRMDERALDLLSELLLRMGRSLGYDFDKVYVRKGWYYPEGLGDIEREQHSLRKSLLRVLNGDSRLPVSVFEQRFEEIIPPKS